MSQWYYSTDESTRLGPVDTMTLLALEKTGQLPPHALVWTMGMAEWQRWDSVRMTLPEAQAADAEHAQATAIPTPAPTAMPAAAPAQADALQIGATATLGDSTKTPDTAPAAANPAVFTTDSSSPGATAGTQHTASYHPTPPPQPATTAAATQSNPYAAPTTVLNPSDEDTVVLGHPVVYAGFLKRVAALIIDTIITTAISYAIQIPLLIALTLSAGGGSDAVIAIGITVLYLLGFAIPLFYMAWMHSSKYQATLGKMAVGIKVVRSDGTRLTFWRAFGRFFAYLLSTILLLIGLIMTAFTDRKRALHDILCDTLVVDKWAYTAYPQWQRQSLGAVTWVVLVIIALAILASLIGFFSAVFLFGEGPSVFNLPAQS